MTLPEELAALAAIPAPTGAEDARLQWVEQRIAHLPGARGRDAAGNLLWRSSLDPPDLLVMAHIDTVFDDVAPARSPGRRRPGRDRVSGTTRPPWWR